MPPCVAYEELLAALEMNFLVEVVQPAEIPGERLEWLLERHDTDGAEGCDWCLMAEEIRRLRDELAREGIRRLRDELTAARS